MGSTRIVNSLSCNQMEVVVTKIRFGVSCAVLAIMISFVSETTAQERWTWPEFPENLQVLPADWPGSRLRPVMRGFSRALGVRCSHCHVGEEGEPLSTYNFASDDNPNKDRAREMLRLLGSVNDHLDKIEPSGDKRVNMRCDTCHRGRPRPMTIGEELGEKYRSGGIEEALAHFAELKSRYYGKGAYNFGEDALNDFGYEILGGEDLQGAIRIFTMNTEEFPESANVWDSLGEAHLTAGDKDLAIRDYSKSLELDPDNDNAAAILKDLRE